MKIPIKYFKNPDLLFLSKDLLGKYLMTYIDGCLTGGIIIETEAYRGPEDKASHAFGGRRTKRNEAMYRSGGISYVYFCYGIHCLFNIVTNTSDIPHAILIRAIEPTEGISEMLKRRKKVKFDQTLTSGPGALTQALGITLKQNFASLEGPEIWLEDRGNMILSTDILEAPRVGIDYAGEDAHLPWRFRIKPVIVRKSRVKDNK